MKFLIRFITIILVFYTLNNTTFALWTRDTWYQAAAYSVVLRVSPTQTCRYVIRSGTSLAFFIPTRDWNQFNSVGNHPNLTIRVCDARSVWWWSACVYNSANKYVGWATYGCGGYQTRSVTCPSWFCDPWAVPTNRQNCRVPNWNRYDYNNCSPWRAYPWNPCARWCPSTYSSTAKWYVNYNFDCWWDCDTNSATYLLR